MDKIEKLILSTIAVSLITLNIMIYNDKNFEFMSKAHAVESHYHYSFEIFDLDTSHSHSGQYADYSHSHSSWEIMSFEYDVEDIIEDCYISGSYISC